MRQKLINTRQPVMLKGIAAKSLEKNTALTLQSLLFDAGISKEQWINAIKEHSKNLTNILLNDQTEEFSRYLSTQLDASLLKPGVSAIKGGKTQKKDELRTAIDASSLLKLDYKAFLQEFLQLAILIEHSTIPPYLTALYSIKDGTNALAGQIIRSVAVEEMLHMIMVCNVMNSLSIAPSVNRPQNYPVYPMKLPLNVDFYVGLEKFSTNSIATFIAIESPSSPMVKAPVFDHITEKSMLKAGKATPPEDLWGFANLKKFLEENVNTIGEFYDVLFFFIVVFQALAFYKANGRFPSSFEELNKGGIFTGDPAKQIRPEQYYGSGGKLYAVVDLKGVMEVFAEIKGQGEGADDTIFDVDPSQFEEGAELAHYFRFKEIFHEHFYKDGKYEPFMDGKGMMPVTTPPTGKPLAVEWDKAYPMEPNPKVADMQSNPALYAQAKAFNVTYKKLLDAIQAAVEGRAEELEKSIMYMYALKEQAVELMKQPLTAQTNAGPTFEYPTN